MADTPSLADRKITKAESRLLQMFDTPNLLDGYRPVPEDNPAYDVDKSLLIREIFNVIDLTTNRAMATYFLRFLKQHQLITKHLKETYKPESERVKIEFTKKEQLFLKRMQELLPIERAVDISDMYRRLEHIRDSDIPVLNNYVYEVQPYFDMADEQNNLEQGYYQELSRFIPVKPESEETILFEKDGFYMVDLHVSGSREEADAMGHCGNGVGRYDQRVLSLRSKHLRGGDEHWKPHVTMILNDIKYDEDGNIMGWTGEIKGYANEKPSEQYHGFLTDFICETPHITAINGGGYLAQNNFMLGDLSKERRERILESRPELFTALELAMHDGRVTDRAVERMKQVVGIENAEDKLFVAEWDNAQEMAEELDCSTLLRTLEWMEDEGSFGHQFDGHPSPDDGDVEKLLEGLEKSNNELFNEVVAFAHYEYELEDATVDEIASEIVDANDDLKSAFSGAHCRAAEIGADVECWEYISECLKDIKQLEGYTFEDDDEGGTKLTCTSKEYLEHVLYCINEHDGNLGSNYAEGACFYDFNEMMQRADRDESPLDYDFIVDRLKEEVDDLSEPYYGYSGYDLETGVDDLDYQLSCFDLTVPDVEFDSKLDQAVQAIEGEPVTPAPTVKPTGITL